MCGSRPRSSRSCSRWRCSARPPAAALGLADDDPRPRLRGSTTTTKLADLAGWPAFPLIGGLVVRWSAVPPGQSINFGPARLRRLLPHERPELPVRPGPALRQGEHVAHRRRAPPVRPAAAVDRARRRTAVLIALTYNVVGFGALAAARHRPAALPVPAGELLLSQEPRRASAAHRAAGALQVGVLATLIQTLAAARQDDRAPLRRRRPLHAGDRAGDAARRATEQDLVHTAGLLHDIGKFIFPDSILFADRKLTDEDWEIVKKHPAQGAKLVRRRRRLRPGGRHHPRPPRAHGRHAATRTACRRGDPAALTHDLRRRHLRRHDRARLLPRPVSPQRRSPSCGASRARSSTATSSRRSSACWSARSSPSSTRRRRRLRG